jgi:transmembrane sensor
MKEELIVKHLVGETEAHENVLINNWRMASEENEKTYQQLEQIWTNSKMQANKKTFDVNKAWMNVEHQIQDRKKEKVIVFRKTWLLAASLVLLLGVALALFNVLNQENLIQMTAVKNQNLKMNLEDGTEITLKEGHFSYPKTFDGDQRKVVLNEGIVFFKVAKNPSKPFVIELGDAHVTVLGTQFEVSKIKGIIQVKVKEGKVKFSCNDGERILIANQSLNYNTKAHQIKEEVIKDDNAFSYVSNSLHFNYTPMREVVNSLNQYYTNRHIEIDAEIENCKLSANFDHEKLENVLEVIKATMNVQVYWDRKSNSYKIEGKGCTP